MKAQRFWNWFIRNKGKLETFIQSDISDYSIFNKLTRKIKKVNSFLYPEITMDTENNFVFIITCDGIADGLQAVIKLADSAPVIDKWIIKKFRQPCDKMSLNFQDIAFEAEDIKIWRKFDIEKGKVDIALLIKNYDQDDDRYRSLGYLYLDHFLGEFNTITRVGQIDFLSWESLKDNIETIDLLTLRNEISNKLY